MLINSTYRMYKGKSGCKIRCKIIKGTGYTNQLVNDIYIIYFNIFHISYLIAPTLFAYLFFIVKIIR